MDVTDFLRQLQPYLAPIAIAAMIMMATWLRNLGKRIDLNTEQRQVAVDKSEVEVKEAELKVKREEFYLESTRDMYSRVKKLEDKDEANEKRIDDLIERDQEQDNVLTALRNQRDEQDKELARLNGEIKDLKAEITKLQGDNAELNQKVKDEQEARVRAETARDTAENAHKLERERLNSEIQSLRDELTQVQSRMGTAEIMIQAQEDKGISSQ